MFLILGILIVLFMITLRVSIEPAKRITRPAEFDVNNIRDEFSNVQKYTVSNQTKIVENLDDFTDFMRTRLGQRKIDLNAIYVNGYIDEKNSENITITVGNYLGNTITNVNVSFGNATGEQGSFLINSLGDGNSSSENITFSVVGEQKHINVTYTMNDNRETLFFTFTPRSDYDTVTTLFDLVYQILDKTTTDQFIQTDYK